MFKDGQYCDRVKVQHLYFVKIRYGCNICCPVICAECMAGQR